MKKISGFILLIYLALPVHAQQDSAEIRPFQFTFVSPIGTNGLQSLNIINEFSLNILFGANGGVDGFELGGLINTIKGNVSGAQIAGFGNLVGGEVNAAQIGGFFNINEGYTEGAQIAGFINIVHDSTKSAQIAGFSNISGYSEGLQASGFGNISGNNDGMQLAGFGNISGNMTGVQTSGFINVAGNLDGFQGAGFMNIAGKIKGVQLAGFLNICDSVDGIPIAPVSIVKKGGYMKGEFWTNEMYYLNASFKIGVPKFYTVYSIGYRPGFNDYAWNFGYGAGTSVIISDNISFDPQIGVTHFFTHLRRNYNQLNQLRLIFNYQINDRVGVFAGPVLNFLLTEYTGDATEIAPSWSFNISERQNSVSKGWFGYQFGLRLF